MSAAVDSVSAPNDVPFLDVVDPEFQFNGSQVAQAQAGSWYAESQIGPLVLRYAEAQELLRDPRLALNGKLYLETNGIFDGPVYDWFSEILGVRHGEDHRRLRGLVNKAFSSRMISNLRPFIRTTAERLTDHLATRQECDFVEDFANKLPMAVMCQLLGIPNEDYEKFRTWTSDIALIFSIAEGGDVLARLEAAVAGMNGYADSLIEDKTATPTDDLISALIAVRQDGSRLSAEELRNLVVTLVFAAHDTTRHQLSNAMVAFARHHDQWRLLAQHPELATQAVEEVMRWHPTTNCIYRFANEDLEYKGLRMAQDSFLIICAAAAQRDPRAFDNPDSFDISITRQAAPLQFGGGPHYCLGAALARAELSEALPVLANRLGPPSIIGPAPWNTAIAVNGPQMLRLRFGQPSRDSGTTR